MRLLGETTIQHYRENVIFLCEVVQHQPVPLLVSEMDRGVESQMLVLNLKVWGI